MAEAYRARLTALKAMANVIRSLGTDRYRIVRGVIPLTGHDWRYRPFIAALNVTDFPLVRAGSEPFYKATFSLALATKLAIESDARREDLVEGMDEHVLDQLTQDAEAFLDLLLQQQNEQGDPIIARLITTGDLATRAREFADASYSIQGIEISFTVEY